MNPLYESATSVQKEKIEAHFDLICLARDQYFKYTTKTKKNTVVRSVGLWLFELKEIKVLATNLWSENLIEDYNNCLVNEGISWTKIPKSKVKRLEHFLGRNSAAEFFLQAYKDEAPSFEEFCDFILHYARYHYTTAKENQEIKKAFTRGAKNWIEAYEQACVKLWEISIRKEGTSNKEIVKMNCPTVDELKHRFRY